MSSFQVTNNSQDASLRTPTPRKNIQWTSPLELALASLTMKHSGHLKTDTSMKMKWKAIQLEFTNLADVNFKVNCEADTLKSTTNRWN